MTIIDVGTAAEAADVIWALTWCVFSGGFGFILGTKLKLIRKIEEMV
jgi:hypothetical protein